MPTLTVQQHCCEVANEKVPGSSMSSSAHWERAYNSELARVGIWIEEDGLAPRWAWRAGARRVSE